jgi:hypothetical protein
MTIFYKMKLMSAEDGMTIYCNNFISIHETFCFHFCVSQWGFNRLSNDKSSSNECILRKAKRLGIKVRRICKSGSRIAFPTKNEAFNNLKFLKNLQIQHLQRDLDLIKTSLNIISDMAYDDLEERPFNDESSATIPNTREIVHGYFNFG